MLVLNVVIDDCVVPHEATMTTAEEHERYAGYSSTFVCDDLIVSALSGHRAGK